MTETTSQRVGGRLGLPWLLCVFVASSSVYLMSFPHLTTEGWRWAVAVTAVGTAVAVAIVIFRAHPPALPASERRYAALYALLYPVTAVLLFFVLVGLANLSARIAELFSWDLSGLRNLADAGLLGIIAMYGYVGYEETWRPELVERAAGVPSGWAHYDPGSGRGWTKDHIRFVLQVAVVAGAIVATLVIREWWCTLPAAFFVLALSVAVEPKSDEEVVADTVDDAKAAFEAQGFTIAPAGDSDAPVHEQATINPLIRTVDFRAVRPDVEFAVGVYGQEISVVDWQVASRLVSAARALGWSKSDGGGIADVVPVLVLVDARTDPTLQQFAADEHLAIVEVSTSDQRATASGSPFGTDLVAVGTMLLRSDDRSGHG